MCRLPFNDGRDDDESVKSIHNVALLGRNDNPEAGSNSVPTSAQSAEGLTNVLSTNMQTTGVGVGLAGITSPHSQSHLDKDRLESYSYAQIPLSQNTETTNSVERRDHSPVYPSLNNPGVQSSRHSVKGTAVSSGTNLPHRQYPTSTANFAALFPAPPSITSITNSRRSSYTGHHYQNQEYQPYIPSQESTRTRIPSHSTSLYHPYSRPSTALDTSSGVRTHSSASSSIGSPAPSFSSKPSNNSQSRSRAVSASDFSSSSQSPLYSLPSLYSGSPAPSNYQSDSNSSNFDSGSNLSPAPGLTSTLPPLTSSTHLPWSSVIHASPLSAPPRPYKATSTGSIVSTAFNQQRSSAGSITPHPHLAPHQDTSYPFAFTPDQAEGEQELVLFSDIDERAQDSVRNRETSLHPSAAGSGASFSSYLQPSESAVRSSSGLTPGANVGKGTSSGSVGPYYIRDSTGRGVTGTNESSRLLAPFTQEELHHSALDHHKPINPSEFFRLSSQSSGRVASFNPNKMFNPSLEMDPRESGDEDDILGNLPHGSAVGLNYSSIGNMSDNKKDEKQVRRRSSKACDQCRKSKCKCERSAEGESCKNCAMLGTLCTFLGPSRKRGPPKGYIDAIESRLHQTEALVGIILSLANPERGLLDDDPKPDDRARSLIEDLRNNDPLAREIVERVDCGAYGTKGRRAGLSFSGNAKNPRAGSAASGDEGLGDISSGTVKDNNKNVGGSQVQGRPRKTGVGQESEPGILLSTHPSNEWQDAVVERLKVAARTRNTTNVSSPSNYIGSGPLTTQNSHESGGKDFRESQRRRVDGQSNNELSSHSPERNSYPQSANRQSIHALTNTSDILGPLTGMGGARYSPVNLPSSVRSSVDLTNNLGSVYGDTQSQADSSILEDDEHVEGEEGITDGVGQLSINEEAQVRFHGKASGLHILGQKIRPDGRNKGGIWRFPRARVWPPVAPNSSLHIARAQVVEAHDRAARARLPSREIQEHLLELYFSHVHPFLPILHKETFLADFRKMHDEKEPEAEAHEHPIAENSGSCEEGTDGSKTPDGRKNSSSRRIPTLLLFAIFSIAARYSTIPHGTTASPLQVTGEQSLSSNEPSFENEKGIPPKEGTVSISPPKPTATPPNDLEADSELPHPQSGLMWAAGDGFLMRAKQLLDMVYSNSRPSTCQALLLMGYREIGIGAMAQSWLYVGMAVRMAQDLGMHRSSDNWSSGEGPIFTPIEQQLRKRIWYACVIMDKYVSTYIGRPLSIFESDYDTTLPSCHEVEEIELWQPHNSLPNTVLSDPIEVGSTPLHPFAPVPGRIISCFNESARLSSILAMIVQAIYTVRNTPTRTSDAAQLERTLDKWYNELPDYLRYDSSVKSVTAPPPHVLTLHMQYWCAVLLLHRPFVPHYIAMRRKRNSSPESPVDQEVFSAAHKNFSLCVSAANHITSIVSIYQEHFCLKRCPVFLSYYIFTAGIMHLTTLATNANDPQASLGLSKCMDILKRMEVVWPSAGRAWELLHGAKDDLPDFDLPVTSSDRSRKRSAEEALDTVKLNDPVPPDSRVDQSQSVPIYPTAIVNGHHYPPAMDVPQTQTAHPSSSLFPYNRWAPESTLGFSAGLTTSVLPQQYSLGFSDRIPAGIRRSSNGIVPNPDRYSEYWDYSMGHPSSMLESMYNITALSASNQNAQSNAHTSHHSHSHSQNYTNATPVYINNQYPGVFNHITPP